MLRADVHKQLGEFELAATLEVAPGLPLVVVGESGSGKTTLLRLLAGLERPVRGRITLDRETWFDGATRTWVPPERRAVGYVAQDDASFPHLNVFENVAFGPRAAGLSDARGRAERALERVGMQSMARRRPRELSGGQRQRMAIARAIAAGPKLLLLDEPLSALDVASRRAVRLELKQIIEGLGCITVLVTHSPTEALALGGSIAVLSGGKVSQQGSGDDLLRHPRSEFVADFMGLNLLRGVIESGAGEASVGELPAAGTVAVEPRVSGLVCVRVGDARLSAMTHEGETFAPGDDAFVVVDPRDIVLSPETPTGTAQNTVLGPIAEMTPEPPHGERLRVTLGSNPTLVAEITRAAAVRLSLAPGVMVWATFKATGARAFR